MSSEALAVRTIDPETSAPAAGPSMATTGAATSLATVTLTGAAVPVRPAASRATAPIVCAPFGAPAVFQVAVNGAATSSAPSGTPSRKNWTPTTRTSSDALAVRVTLPARPAFAAGLVTETVGSTASF